MPKIDLTDEEQSAAAAHEPRRRGAARTTDQFVGARLRDRRLMLGLSRRDLADRLDRVSQQTIYKYELGIASVSAALLHKIAGALGTSVDYFFDGLETNEKVEAPREFLNLMRSLGEIKSEEHLEVISHVVRVLANRSRAGGS
jgi:transcriptional regulator with XRE-family HTH domain